MEKLGSIAWTCNAGHVACDQSSDFCTCTVCTKLATHCRRLAKGLTCTLCRHIHFVEALVVGACVTPTDPVLSNSIVKGKFADKNIPKELQKIIIAESGANDGLGYPFLFLPLYLIQHSGLGSDHSTANAIGAWFGETWGYTIILSIVYGATVGYIAKELLHWAEEHHYVDRESFLVFAITLAVSQYHSPLCDHYFAWSLAIKLVRNTRIANDKFYTALSGRDHGHGRI